MNDNITPSHVANFFLAKAQKESRTITNCKLIKLTYIAYGWTLAILDRRLFHERIEAWGYGPVIPSLYHEFKEFRNDPINSYSMQLDDSNYTKQTTPEIKKRETDILFVLNYVWRVYKRFTADSLCSLTCEEGTPWYSTYKKDERHTKIQPEEIKKHFSKKIEEYMPARAAS